MVCANYLEYNVNNEGHKHHGFSKTSYELYHMVKLVINGELI